MILPSYRFMAMRYANARLCLRGKLYAFRGLSGRGQTRKDQCEHRANLNLILILSRRARLFICNPYCNPTPNPNPDGIKEWYEGEHFINLKPGLIWKDKEHGNKRGDSLNSKKVSSCDDFDFYSNCRLW